MGDLVGSDTYGNSTVYTSGQSSWGAGFAKCREIIDMIVTSCPNLNAYITNGSMNAQGQASMAISIPSNGYTASKLKIYRELCKSPIPPVPLPPMFDFVAVDGANTIALRKGVDKSTIINKLIQCATGEGTSVSVNDLQGKTIVDDYAAALLGYNALIGASVVVSATDLSLNGYTPLYFPDAFQQLGGALKPTNFDTYMSNNVKIDLVA